MRHGRAKAKGLEKKRKEKKNSTKEKKGRGEWIVGNANRRI